MAGKIFKKEQDTFTSFVCLDETGEARLFTVSDSGEAFEHEGFYNGEFADYFDGEIYFATHGWETVSTRTDFAFYSLVVNAANQGIGVDDLVYDIPGAREKVDCMAFATRKWAEQNRVVKIVSSVKVDQDEL